MLRWTTWDKIIVFSVLHFLLLIAEYSTGKELLESLQKDTMDKIWLFPDCKTKDIPVDFNIMIVSVLREETMESPYIGLDIQMAKTSDNSSNTFMECLYSDEHPHGVELSSGSILSPVY